MTLLLPRTGHTATELGRAVRYLDQRLAELETAHQAFVSYVLSRLLGHDTLEGDAVGPLMAEDGQLIAADGLPDSAPNWSSFYAAYQAGDFVDLSTTDGPWLATEEGDPLATEAGDLIETDAPAAVLEEFAYYGHEAV